MNEARVPTVPAGTPAVVLLSGGLDSATVLAMAMRAGYACHALSFRYGQRHAIELDRARELALRMGAAQQVVLDIDLRQFGGSALTGAAAVPKQRSLDAIGQAIPVTYVPARNTVFLSLALAWAETLHAFDIFIGVNALDYSGYPDCRPAYIAAFERMANLATKAGVEGARRLRVRTPLIALGKADIVRTGTEVGVDFGLTGSCYDPTPSGAPCRQCDACMLRAKGCAEAGLPDPLLQAGCG
jgi:7-cyano-7-deazaguanine synthase